MTVDLPATLILARDTPTPISQCALWVGLRTPTPPPFGISFWGWRGEKGEGPGVCSEGPWRLFRESVRSVSLSGPHSPAPFCDLRLWRVSTSPHQPGGRWSPSPLGCAEGLECRAGRAQTFSCTGSLRWG